MRRVLPLWMIAAASVWAQSPMDAVLNKMDRDAASFHAVTGSLKQTAHTAVVNEDNVESGAMKMKRLHAGATEMLVTFNPPELKTVWLDGNTLSIYLPKANTVQQYNLGSNAALIDRFLLLGFGTSRQDLLAENEVKDGGEETVNGQKAVKLVLLPKSQDIRQHVQKIELWLSADTGYPIQHKISQPSGDYQLVQFSNLHFVADLPDSGLKLHLPKNVKIEKPQS